MAEIVFEQGLGSLETTRGTAIVTANNLFNGTFTLDPKQTWKQLQESVGTWEGAYTELKQTQNTEWSFSGTADYNQLQFWLRMAVKGGVAATTPSAGVSLWTFLPTITADDLNTATLWGFDPNVTRMQAAMCYMGKFSIKAKNADSVDLALSGKGKFASVGSGVTAPAKGAMKPISIAGSKVYIDTAAGSYGGTLLTGRLVDYGYDLPETLTEKYFPEGNTDLSALGRKARSPKLMIQLEVPDLTEYNKFAAGTYHKVRLTTQGDLIASTYYHFLQIDIYGRLQKESWGAYAGSNRTINLSVNGIYESSLGASSLIKLQNTAATVS